MDWLTDIQLTGCSKLPRALVAELAATVYYNRLGQDRFKVKDAISELLQQYGEAA